MEVLRLAEKNRRMVTFRTAEGVGVVSGSEVLIMFVTADGEDPPRNISERQMKV